VNSESKLTTRLVVIVYLYFFPRLTATAAVFDVLQALRGSTTAYRYAC